MGSELSCPCSGKINEGDNTAKKSNEEISKIVQYRLGKEDIIYEYFYENTKILVIKTINLEKFFNTRSLLKLTNNKETNDYFDKIFIANFLGRIDLTSIILQSSFQNRLTAGKNETKKGKKKKNPDYNAKFSIENLILFSDDRYKNAEKILLDINTKLKKNYVFIGSAIDLDNTNKSYKILYKGSLMDKTNLEYSVDFYDDNFDEKKIEDFLNNRVNKRSILKSIIIDFETITPKETTKGEDEKLTNKRNKFFYFIFEDNPIDPFLYDYNVIKMNKDTNNKDSFMKDITSKLNDYQQFFTLTTFITFENCILLFMIMPTDMYTLDEIRTQF